MDEKRMEAARKFLSHVEISKAVAQNNTEITVSHLDKIENIWKKENELLQERGGSLSMEECLLDLTVLEITGGDLAHCLKNIKPTANQFSLEEFTNKMNAKYSPNGEYNWETISEKANPIINRMPGFPLLLGTFKLRDLSEIPASRKRKATEPRPKDEKMDRQNAERIVTTEKADIDWDKYHFVVDSLNKCYAENDYEPIPFYHFILHPTDFTLTVENIFQMSFLIREGRALMEVDGDEVYISPMKKKINSDGQALTKAKQCIFSITMSQWKELVEQLGILTPAIPWQNDETPEFKVESPYRSEDYFD